MLNVQPPLSYCNSTGGCSTPCQSANDCASCGGSASSCLNASPRFVVNDLNSGVVPRTNRPTPARSSVYNLQPGQSLTLYFTADDGENILRIFHNVSSQPLQDHHACSDPAWFSFDAHDSDCSDRLLCCQRLHLRRSLFSASDSDRHLQPDGF